MADDARLADYAILGGLVPDLQLGAMLDLAVDAFKAGDYTTVGSSAFPGQFTGTLHLRPPRGQARFPFQMERLRQMGYVRSKSM